MLTNPPPEEKNSTLERGTMIHEYILQPEEFQKDYVVWDKAKPSSIQQEKFCQEFINSIELEPNKRVLSAYKKAYSTKGKSEDLMLSEGLKIASNLSKYIDFLKSGDQRILISPYDAKTLHNIKQNIQEHKLANKLVWFVGYSEYLADSSILAKDEMAFFHEFHINWEFNGVRCKSLLDGLTLDFMNKKAIIYDLKTTQKLWYFEESMNTYDYLRQLCYYSMAVAWYLSEELEEDPSEWGMSWYIVGIDTTGSNEIRVFEFTQDQVYSRYEIIVKALEDIYWHQANDKWDHSRAYYQGDGSELLNL